MTTEYEDEPQEEQTLYFGCIPEDELTPDKIPLEYYKSLNLIDDKLFSKVAAYPEAMQEILQTILERDDLIVDRVETQKNIRNIDHRSVILDAYCVLADGSRVNVEVQKTDDDDLQRRMRYNLSNMDTAMTETGTDFAELPDVYLIVISSFDVFDQGHTIYHVKRSVEGIAGQEHEVYNGVTEIYVNTAVESDSRIGQLMDYFRHSVAENAIFPNLAAKVKDHTYTEKGLKNMKSYDDVLFANGRRLGKSEGHAEGKAENQLETAKRLLDMGNMTYEQMAHISGLSLEKVKELAAQTAV